MLQHVFWHIRLVGFEQLVGDRRINVEYVVEFVDRIPNANRNGELYNLLFKSSVRSIAILRRSSRSEVL